MGKFLLFLLSLVFLFFFCILFLRATAGGDSLGGGRETAADAHSRRGEIIAGDAAVERDGTGADGGGGREGDERVRGGGEGRERPL